MQCLTEAQFENQLVVILAGYPAQLDQLMQANPGLPSRFTGKLVFEPFGLEQAVEMVRSDLRKENAPVAPEADAALPAHVQQMMAAPQWSSGRDCINLSRAIQRAFDRSVYEAEKAVQPAPHAISTGDVAAATAAMLASKVPEDDSMSLGVRVSAVPSAAQLLPPAAASEAQPNHATDHRTKHDRQEGKKRPQHSAPLAAPASCKAGHSHPAELHAHASVQQKGSASLALGDDHDAPLDSDDPMHDPAYREFVGDLDVSMGALSLDPATVFGAVLQGTLPSSLMAHLRSQSPESVVAFQRYQSHLRMLAEQWQRRERERREEEERLERLRVEEQAKRRAEETRIAAIAAAAEREAARRDEAERAAKAARKMEEQRQRMILRSQMCPWNVHRSGEWCGAGGFTVPYIQSYA